MKNKIAVFWFRRDLRIDDNVAFYKALTSGFSVLPIFIFDTKIIDSLPKDDARITFIYQTLKDLDYQFKNNDGSLYIQKGTTLEVWKKLVDEFDIDTVFFNKDYEPYAIKRDKEIAQFLATKNIQTKSFKDQVIFEEEEVLKNDHTPYTVFTPYKKKWLKHFEREIHTQGYKSEAHLGALLKLNTAFISLEEIGFVTSKIKVKPYNLESLSKYDEIRNFPALDKTSNLSPYLRFGLVSVRKMVVLALETNATFLSELIWREFFMQILFHFPKVVTDNFKQKYDYIPWRNNKEEFAKWCKGETGYPIVDAGMRELNTTGYMHNRVRMIVASFLCKHLLIDWRWGEAYFAEKLLDYDLSANNGNWQWSAGTGSDAAPYFRVFNPSEQIKKFDKDLKYIKKWVQDFDDLSYPQPMVDHKMARERAIKTYKDALTV
ncbi:cryptochrome/photolyase family protein [Polaribacter sargassicola]|uniref:cryptochrome/photolyase family protein n=1 Tax=Polaribacter sargassicola TaxID=2836891 RepID=UPI001F2EDE96|nr:deoxyribodipyrimidine photo-lyase [Polaribacter sp. DS7-9]MCG1037699.1 DNA photolyase family protein [Polaribacter sp. DS7-9]